METPTQRLAEADKAHQANLARAKSPIEQIRQKSMAPWEQGWEKDRVAQSAAALASVTKENSAIAKLHDPSGVPKLATTMSMPKASIKVSK